MKVPNLHLLIFLSLSKLECVPKEINSWKILLHLTFLANWKKRDKVILSWFEVTRIHFKSDVFVAVTVVDAKAPLIDWLLPKSIVH